MTFLAYFSYLVTVCVGHFSVIPFGQSECHDSGCNERLNLRNGVNYILPYFLRLSPDFGKIQKKKRKIF